MKGTQLGVVSPHHSGLYLARLRPLQPLMVEAGHGHAPQWEGHLLDST